jgi:predicted ATPase/DNA-binding XRE family transcriptional regulator
VGEADSLGTVLVGLRVQAGMSQEQLAAAAGVSAQAISDIERGVTLTPRSATIERIAVALGLDATLRQRLASLRSVASQAQPDGSHASGDLQVDGDAPEGFAASNLGQAVAFLRTRRRLSMTELAKQSGLSSRSIADIEAGRRKRIHPANAISLADVLGLTGEPRRRFLDLASGLVVPEAIRLGVVETANMAGREQELAAVLALLTDQRLVSLTGPGGVGKTTLAEAALARLERPSVSMFLADVPPGENLARAIALIGRFDEQSGQEWVSQLNPLLPHGAVLLLDNLEHLLCVPTAITEVLAGRPDIAVLATSRAAIGLADACEIEVRPLRLAAACRAFQTAAAAARQAIPVSAPAGVIEQICTRLDCLPLPIVLAAGWIRLMTPQEILARLDRPAEILRSPDTWLAESSLSADGRHNAIVRTVGWSLALVRESARTLFRVLAAYPAPWPLDLIEAVYPAADVLDALGELVQAQLVSLTADATGVTTYAMLQTVRDVGRAELAVDGELAGQVFERYAAHLLKKARELSPKFLAKDRAAALAVGDHLALHMEGALRRLIDTGESRAVRLVAAWWRYWKERGRYRSGLALTVESLQTVAATDETMALDTAEALYGAAALAYLTGENEQAFEYATDALTRFHRLRDGPGTANLMSLIGMMELHSGRPETALSWYERGLRQINDKAAPRAYATLLANVAPVHAALGDLAAARAAAEQAAARFQVLGDDGSAAAQLGNLGLWAARAGERERAVELMHESRDLLRRLGDYSSMIEAHLELAQLHADDGDSAAAQAELDAARQLGSLADDTWGNALGDALAAQIAVLSGDMTKARSLARIAMRKGEALGYQAAMVAAALAEGSAAAWSNDRRAALAAACAGLTQSDQADEAAVISLALVAAAVLLDGLEPAAVADVLTLEQMIRSWASSPRGKPYEIARLAARRRGLSLAGGQSRPLPPIAEVRAHALALCPRDAALS